jgi:hypothetical protein
MASPDLDRAAEFLELNARLIDRRRFACLFGDGDAAPVVEALRAYRNPDGGFGNALEPDLRGPESQPQPVALALGMLDEVGAFDDPMVADACDWLVTATAPDGGVPFVLESALAHPRAPWWQPDPEGRGSMLGTPAIAGLLHKHGVEHPWLDGATEMVWRGIAELDATSAYAAMAVFAFLDQVPDRARAEAAMAEIGPRVLESGAVETDPDAPGEAFFPLDFAPAPGRLSRTPFDDTLIERHLDALAAGQRDDGGWMFNWLVWAPLVELEWRGWLTVHALSVLRDNGRL